jgi:hypothetical protein
VLLIISCYRPYHQRLTQGLRARSKAGGGCFSISSSTIHTSAHNHPAQPADVMRDVALKAISKKKVKGNEERV